MFYFYVAERWFFRGLYKGWFLFLDFMRIKVFIVNIFGREGFIINLLEIRVIIFTLGGVIRFFLGVGSIFSSEWIE